MMLESFIYDFDGTISDSYPLFLRIAKEIIARHGALCPCSDAELYRHMKNWVADAYRVTQWHDGTTKADFMEEFFELQRAYFASFELIPYAKEILAAAVDSGKRNYLYTHSGSVVHDIMEHMGIAQYFTYVLDDTKGFPAKPAPDALNDLAERFSLDPGTCLMVGDRPIDVGAGANAGMQSCLLDVEGFFPNTPATYRIQSLRELLPLIQNSN